MIQHHIKLLLLREPLPPAPIGFRTVCKKFSRSLGRIAAFGCFVFLQANARGENPTITNQNQQSEILQERLKIVPLAPACAGDELTAIVHLYNPTEHPAETDIEITVDGKEYARQHVIVQPLAREPVRIRLYLDKPGDYQVSTGKLETQLHLYAKSLDWKEKLEVARRRKRRAIYNNDGGDALYHKNVHTVLDVSTSGLAGSHVDTICYSTVGGLTFWHNSQVGQVVGRGVYDAMQKTLGIDPLELQSEFARQHGMEIFWSMRMNDTHDKVEVWDWLMPQWKRDHPEYLVGQSDKKYDWGAGNWTALDYNHRPVRDYIFDIIEDVAERYDLDGIELDFYRGEPYFKEQLLGQPVTDAQRERMTQLMRRLKDTAEKVSRTRGRPLLLSIRVPDSLAYCQDIGLDVQHWLEEGMADLLIVGGDHRYEPWENMVRLGHQHRRPVYACLAGDYLSQEESDWDDHWRGHALNAWQSGVDGIYTFNFLQHRHELLRQIGEPDVLKETDAVYHFTPGTHWGFLKNEKDYVSAVQANPPSGPITSHQRVVLDLPSQFDHDIRYTTDGSPPTQASLPYKEPIAVDRDVIVKSRSFDSDGIATPIMEKTYRYCQKRYLAADAPLPLDFFGLPNGAELSAIFELPEFEDEAEPLLFLSMMDVDALQEALIYINGKGPLLPPREVLSGLMTRDGYLPLPRKMLKQGKNSITFKFDNLNEGTSGFRVYRAEVVVPFANGKKPE
ncbi:chitobiase/beta-hexosaminidase C-terminal domain-containing protein [Adhaeretor mobilis]|uniref:Uncharacterized protein n=1 Tax=Adhaeretor mobilis TaxID=1930276 RepID=A0A517MWV8_9BACT|nr:chitobiase/beta-hexosaminidase C-terminal domain-containing protein [Adhaeretor mobilis]QDS99297.1 hypothetical protein HG15A2_26190 [Adhaeretor mobilis]